MSALLSLGQSAGQTPGQSCARPPSSPARQDAVTVVTVVTEVTEVKNSLLLLSHLNISPKAVKTVRPNRGDSEKVA